MPWMTLLGLQYFITKRLAVHLRHRRRRASMVVVELTAIPAQAEFNAAQLNPHREAA